MRWPGTRVGAREQAAEPLRDTVDGIDALDPDTLEVIEVDADGRLLGPPRHHLTDAPRELAERPSARDPTGLAGIWEALGHS